MKLRKPSWGQLLFAFIITVIFLCTISTSNARLEIKIVGIILFTLLGILMLTGEVNDDDDDIKLL